MSLDETRVQYILDAVYSARIAFPRQSNNKKKRVQQERISSSKDTIVNGQHWTENDAADQNGLVEGRVSIIIIINYYDNNDKDDNDDKVDDDDDSNKNNS